MSSMNAQYISNSIACWDMSVGMEIFIIIHHGIVLIMHTTNSLYLIGWTKSACVKTTASLTFDWNICPTLLFVEFRLGELVEGCKTLVPLSIHISMIQWELDFLERRQSMDNFSLSSSRTVGSSLVCILKQFTPDHCETGPHDTGEWHGYGEGVVAPVARADTSLPATFVNAAHSFQLFGNLVVQFQGGTLWNIEEK